MSLTKVVLGSAVFYRVELALAPIGRRHDNITHFLQQQSRRAAFPTFPFP